jgi:hypothetical protein
LHQVYNDTGIKTAKNSYIIPFEEYEKLTKKEVYYINNGKKTKIVQFNVLVSCGLFPSLYPNVVDKNNPTTIDTYSNKRNIGIEYSSPPPCNNATPSSPNVLLTNSDKSTLSTPTKISPSKDSLSSRKFHTPNKNNETIWKDIIENWFVRFEKLKNIGYCSGSNERNLYAQNLKFGKSLNYTIFFNLWNEIKLKTDETTCYQKFQKDMSCHAYFLYLVEINNHTKVNLVEGNGFCGYTNLIYVIKKNSEKEWDDMKLNEIGDYWNFDWNCAMIVDNYLEEDIKYWNARLARLQNDQLLTTGPFEEIIVKLLFKLNGAKEVIDKLKVQVTKSVKDNPKNINKIRETLCRAVRLTKDFWIGDQESVLIFSVRTKFPIISFMLKEVSKDVLINTNATSFACLKNFNSPHNPSISTYTYGNIACPFTEAVVYDNSKFNSGMFTIPTIIELFELKTEAVYCGENHNFNFNIDYKKSSEFINTSFDSLCMEIFDELYIDMKKVFEEDKTNDLFNKDTFKSFCNKSPNSKSKKSEVIDLSISASSSNCLITDFYPEEKPSMKRKYNDNTINLTNESSKKFKIEEENIVKIFKQTIAPMCDCIFDNVEELWEAILLEIKQKIIGKK